MICIIISIMKIYKNGIYFLLVLYLLAVISQAQSSRLSGYYLQDLLKTKREHDGSKNNVQNSKWGATKALLHRQSGTKNGYEDNVGKPISTLPSPRQISNTVGAMKDFEANTQKISLIYVIWGQFLDHDFVSTPVQGGQNAQRMNIKIPKGDPFFDKKKTGRQQMGFNRAEFKIVNGSRLPSNSLTAYIDAGTVYGSSQQTNRRLRSFKNGKLLQSQFNMLPKVENGFDAGDGRVNENFALAAMHTLWMREHNRICDQVIKNSPKLKDQEVYQIARNYVIGLIQKISFNDFMPKLLGPENYQKFFKQRTSYDPKIKPDVMLQMATGLFRVGHTLLNDDFSMRNQNGQVMREFALKDAFNRPDVFKKRTSLDQILMGLMFSPAKQKNCQVIDSVRNFLALDPQNRQFKLDLFSLNLQRSRDHGLLSFGDMRKVFGLQPVTFKDMCQKQSDVIALNKMYKDTNSMDLWVGTICQKPVKDGIMGEFGSKALGQFFSRMKYGDRFYFEWNYPKKIVDEILGTSLGDVIKRNTQLKKMPNDSFEVIKRQIREEPAKTVKQDPVKTVKQDPAKEARQDQNQREQKSDPFNLNLDDFFKRFLG